MGPPSAIIAARPIILDIPLLPPPPPDPPPPDEVCQSAPKLALSVGSEAVLATLGALELSSPALNEPRFGSSTAPPSSKFLRKCIMLCAFISAILWWTSPPFANMLPILEAADSIPPRVFAAMFWLAAEVWALLLLMFDCIPTLALLALVLAFWRIACSF